MDDACGLFDDDDFTAAEMCCGCLGGAYDDEEDEDEEDEGEEDEGESDDDEIETGTCLEVWSDDADDGCTDQQYGCPAVACDGDAKPWCSAVGGGWFYCDPDAADTADDESNYDDGELCSKDADCDDGMSCEPFEGPDSVDSRRLSPRRNLRFGHMTMEGLCVAPDESE